ncbi:hypothetical protein FE236_00805 [Mariprofundus erugo]|uniref:hypothetical protein n=1 Tax=Mariprofundus erugo TaxID=2528639 RepID=UPI0010FF1F7D|nr:hypothetical protein [Mariprofundus erugo]TLS78326.1 hypothetical protein FE236_00805 [Mariprofundus erugo]
MIRTIVWMMVCGLAAALSPPLWAAPVADRDMLSAIKSMESPAEDMFDAIAGKDMQQLNRLFDALAASMATLNRSRTDLSDEQERNIAMLNSWFDIVALEMQEMDDFPALASAINQFTAQMIISMPAEHAYEKNVAWMDYLGRELLLLNQYPSDSSNRTALQRARKRDLQANWLEISAMMNTTPQGAQLVAKADPVIHGLMAESSAVKMMVLARSELEWVDQIEHYFHMD